MHHAIAHDVTDPYIMLYCIRPAANFFRLHVVRITASLYLCIFDINAMNFQKTKQLATSTTDSTVIRQLKSHLAAQLDKYFVINE